MNYNCHLYSTILGDTSWICEITPNKLSFYPDIKTEKLIIIQITVFSPQTDWHS